MINWNNFKAGVAATERKKDLLALWYLVWGRPKLATPNNYEEEMDMYGGFDSEVNKDL